MTNKQCEPLSKEKAQLLHHLEAKLLFLSP